MWSPYAILVVQLIYLASWWSVKLWSCSAGVLQMTAFQSLAQPHLHAWNNGDCRILKLDCNVWIPKLLILSRYPGHIGLSQNQEVMTSQTTRDSLQLTNNLQQNTTQNQKKNHRKSPRHWSLSAIFRISPGNNTSIPTEYSKGPSRCLDLADIDQLLGDLAAILGRRTSCKFQEILHKLLTSAMKKHLVMCQLTWKLGALGSLSWWTSRSFTCVVMNCYKPKKKRWSSAATRCDKNQVITYPSLSTIVSVPPSFDSSILPQRCESMWWWLDGNDWMVGISQLIGHIFGHRWMTPTNDTTILLQRGKATAGRFDRDHFTDLVLSKRGFMWCTATRVGRCTRIDLPKTNMCFLESKIFSRTPPFSPWQRLLTL